MSQHDTPLDLDLVFVAGPLRSGTTLFRLMLGAHPQLYNPGEADFLFDYVPPDAALEAIRPLALEALAEKLALDRVFRAHGLEAPAEGPVDRALRDLVRQYDASDRTLVLSIHRNFVTARSVFPEARFVHLLRDPRDCARSSVRMGWAGHLYYGVEQWIEAERSWDRLRRVSPELDALEVYYEKLVRDPHAELTRVCDYLALPFSEAMLDLSHTTYGTPDPRLADQWRHRLTPREAALVESRVREPMQLRGYRLSGDARRPGALERIALALRDRLGRNRASIGRYGLGLWLGEKLFRYVGYERAWQRCRVRMQEITAQQLR